MSAKEDLKTKIQSLESKLSAAYESLNEILINEFPHKVGDKVKNRAGEEFTISAVYIRYGTPGAYGNKTLKSGKPGNRERALYWLR